MRTPLSSNNPFGHSRYGYAAEQVRHLKPQRHLDVGCHDGSWLHGLAALGVEGLYGVDVNADAIRMGQERYPDLVLINTPDTRSLPFADGTFDSISLLDVIEHLDRDYQCSLLSELHRVLKRNGTLVVTVPGKHVFSFLDLGNFKFRFPRLHRWYYCSRYGTHEYEYGYVSNPFGLVGDISVTKRWHEHFSASELAALLSDCGFETVDVDGAGLFTRPLAAAKLCLPIPTVRRLLGSIQESDFRAFSSANLFASCRRLGTG